MSESEQMKAELNELKKTQKRMILESFPTTEKRVKWEQLIQERDQIKAELESETKWAKQYHNEAQQWHDMARSLAEELTDNLPPNIESPALDEFKALEKGTK